MSAIVLAFLPVCLTIAALSDLRAYIIPNTVVAATALAGLAAILVSDLSLDAALAQLSVAFGALAFGFALFSLGVWGGGDGKLIAAAALWFDPSSALSFLIYTLIAGGAVALIGLGAYQMRGWLWRFALLRALPLERWSGHTPYGVGIALGALLAFPQSALFHAAFG